MYGRRIIFDNLRLLAEMDSFINVDINFPWLLLNICLQFSLPPSRYRMTIDADLRFHSYVDVEVPRSSRFMEIIICHGTSFSNLNQAKEDAACATIKRLCNKVGFKVRYVNFEDKKYYKNLYDRIHDKHLELQDEYECLIWTLIFSKSSVIF